MKFTDNVNDITTGKTRVWWSLNVLIILLILDIVISKMYPIFYIKIDDLVWVSIFIFLTLTVILNEFIVLRFLRSTTSDLKILSKKTPLSLINKTIMIIQGIISVAIVYSIYQIFSYEYYSTGILTFVTTLSFAVEALILGLLTQQLSRWFSWNKSYTLLMFILSSSAIVISGILINIQTNTLFENSTPIVLSNNPGITTALTGNTLMEILQECNFIFSIITFALMWATTAFLMYHYSKRIGNKRYWIIISIPLIFYLSQFIFLDIEFFSPLINSDPFFYIILLNTLYSLSLPIGGILFGIAFLTMAKTIGKDNPKVQYYLKFGAYGVILVFVAMQTTITRLNYPPFGILSISIVGLASYVMFVGLYSSAISTSIDKKLMQTIRETISNAKFLHTLAEAEAISQIMNLATIEEEKFKKETGIESSLTVEETTDYLQMVMQEISESKKK